jgi:hypothetical protein
MVENKLLVKELIHAALAALEVCMPHPCVLGPGTICCTVCEGALPALSPCTDRQGTQVRLLTCANVAHMHFPAHVGAHNVLQSNLNHAIVALTML